jgi:hypothetical protein
VVGQVVFAGGELESIQVISGTPTEQAAGGISPSRGIIVMTGAAVARCNFVDNGGAATTVTTGQTLFVHFMFSPRVAGGTTQDVMLIRDSSGYPWVKILSIGFGSGQLVIYGNTGSGASPSWTALHTDTFNATQNYTYDVRVFIAANGIHEVEWSIDQTRVVLDTFTNAAFTNAASFDISGIGGAYQVYYQQLLATQGLSTIGAQVATSTLSGAGNQNTWGTGTYTAINEIPLNDATVMSTTNAGDVATFACTDITTPSNYFIPCVFVWTRGKNSGTTPANIQTVFRISGADYASASLANTGVSYTNQPTRYDQAPSGVPWTDVIFNAAERGVKSVA